jgi:crossover junction endodeoxyribonuclease RusA
VISVTVPIPEKCLSPNARVHWAVRARATRDARFEAAEATYKALRSHKGAPPWTASGFVVNCLWTYGKGQRVMDETNLRGMLKATEDGIADTLLVNDKLFRWLPIKSSRCKGPGFVTLEVIPDE